MKFLAELLITISNNTIPIAFVIFFTGIIASLLQGIGKIKKVKNDFIIKDLEPKVEEIKKLYPEEDTQLEELSKLYKQYHFSPIIATLFKVLGIIFYIIMFITIFTGTNFNIESCLKPINFFNIENIFTRNLLIVIPVLTVIFKMISTYIFIPKELADKKTILINLATTIITIALLSNIFSTTYALYLLGYNFAEILTSIPINKKKRELYYKYPPTEEDIKKQQELQNQPKKSLKEIIKDMEKDLNI